MPPILEARDVTRRYRVGSGDVEAVRGVSLAVEPGEFVAFMGPSGSGKSTLLHLLGGLDRPTSGDVVLDGALVSRLSDDAATKLRREKTGFVFQFFNLVPLLSVWENVALPFTIAGEDARRTEHAGAIRAALASVDLAGKERNRDGDPGSSLALVPRGRPDRGPRHARCEGGGVRRPGLCLARWIAPRRDPAGPPRGPRGRPSDRAARRPGPLTRARPQRAGPPDPGREAAPNHPHDRRDRPWRRRAGRGPRPQRRPGRGRRAERPRPAGAHRPARRGIPGARALPGVAGCAGNDAGRRRRRAGAGAADLSGPGSTRRVWLARARD